MKIIRSFKAFGLNVVMSAILIASSFWTWNIQSHINGQRILIRHQVDLYRACEIVYSDIRYMETSQRGFLLTGDSTYLRPYLTKVANLDRDLAVYKALCESEDEQITYGVIKEATNLKAKELAATVDLQSTNRHDEALEIVKTNAGQSYMDTLYDAAESMRIDYVNSTAAYRDWIDIRTYVLMVNFIWIVMFSFVSIWTTFGNFILEKRALQRSTAMAAHLIAAREEWKEKLYEPGKREEGTSRTEEGSKTSRQ